MPARIDWVGRAHELKVRHLLKPTKKNKADLDKVLLKIKDKYPNKYKQHFKRISVGARNTVHFIKEKIIGKKKIKEVEYKGEEAKGISDVDLIIHFTDSSKEDLSLKLYKSKQFNLWNPTLETLLLHLTGKGFSDYLNKRELSRYLQEMKALKDRSIESKSIAPRWVKKAAGILARFHRNNPKLFRKNLLEKLGYASTIVAPIVDERGKFKRLIAEYPELIELLAQGKGKLRITTESITIKILINNKLLTSFAVYAQSGSRGRSGGLRIATWTPYV